MASATPRRTSCPLELLMEKIWQLEDEDYDGDKDDDDDDDRIDDQIGHSRKAALIRKAIFSPRCINPYGRCPADQIVRGINLNHTLFILTLDI